MKTPRRNRLSTIGLVLSATFAITLPALAQSARINLAGEDRLWTTIPGTWVNNSGTLLTNPTTVYGSPHNFFIANNTNVIFGSTDEVVTVNHLKVGALGSSGSSPSSLYAPITNPNGRLTIIGGSLTVSTSTFNIGDANPYSGAGWTDPIRGEVYLQGGTLASGAVYVGARRGDLTHGGRTEGYFEQTGGTLSVTNSFYVGAASNENNTENVNGVARVTGGITNINSILIVGVLQRSSSLGDPWTPEELAGRGHGRLEIGPNANITAVNFEARHNSEIVFEIGAGGLFNPISITSAVRFYEGGAIIVDGSQLAFDPDLTAVTLMEYGSIHASHIFNPDLVQFLGFDPQYTPSIEFQPNVLVLHVVPEPATYALLLGVGAMALVFRKRRLR